MGAWQYCGRCDAAMRQPTLGELIAKEMRCPNGHPQEPVGDIAEFADATEREVERLRQQVDWLLALAREVGREPPEFD